MYVYRGHQDILSRVETAAKSNPGLFLGGNYRSGVAFGDCVQYGADVAKEVGAFVKASQSQSSD